MRIAHVITRLIIGGAQENTLLICAGLAEAGHDVTLIAGTQTGPEGSLWSEAVRMGVRTIEFPPLVRQVAPLTDWSCARELAALFRREQFDVVHTHSSKAGILGRWAAHKAGTPLVVHTIHGMSFNRTQTPPVRWFYRSLERRAAPWTDAFISVADAMTAQAVAAGIAPAERFTTIYSGMRVDDFHADPDLRTMNRAVWKLEPDQIVIGTVARLFRNKGYEHILAALPRIVERCPRARFVWVGDGRDRGRYQATLAKLGRTGRVRFEGLVPPARIPQLLAGFDILLHASLWEGLPRAAVQALLTEVPVVCFALDGASEVVETGVTGTCVRPGDTAGLADAVIELANDADRRAALGREGRRRCLERFDYRRMVRDIAALYETRASAPAIGPIESPHRA